MINPFNETLVILLLTLAITMLFDRLVARAAWSATITRSPTTYARCIAHLNRLDAMRSMVIGEDIRWKHG